MPSCCHAQQLGESPIARRFAHVQPFADLSLSFATTPPLRCNHESQPRRETSVNQLHHETPRESHMRLAGKRRAGMNKKETTLEHPNEPKGAAGWNDYAEAGRRDRNRSATPRPSPAHPPAAVRTPGRNSLSFPFPFRTLQVFSESCLWTRVTRWQHNVWEFEHLRRSRTRGPSQPVRCAASQ